MTFRASTIVSARSPELYAGCPQQVCEAGTKTSAPPDSSSLIAANPIDGRIKSTRQVTKKPTRMGGRSGSNDVSTHAAAAWPPRSLEIRLRQRDRAEANQLLRQHAENQQQQPIGRQRDPGVTAH